MNLQLGDSIRDLRPKVVHQFIEALEGKYLDFIFWLAKKRENASCEEKPEMIFIAFAWWALIRKPSRGF